MSDPASTNNPEFIAATEQVRDLVSKPSQEDLLKLYALFKQSIFGDNKTEKPGTLYFKEKAKWEAWLNIQGMTKKEAQDNYIKLVQQLKQSHSN